MALKRNIDDYETILITDEKGHQTTTTVYKGDYFDVSLNKDELFHFKMNCFLLVILCIAFHIGGGFIANPGMYRFYIAIPYALAFLPLFHLAVGVLYLPKEKRKYHRHEIRDSFERMKIASIAYVTLSAIGIFGEIAFVLVTGKNNLIGVELIYITLESLATIAMALVIIKQRKIRIWNRGKQEQG